MSWVTVIWSMAAGVSLTLAAVNVLVWARDREAAANLLFSVSAVAAAVIAMQELTLMRAQTPAEFGTLLRGMHVSAATIVIAVVWFIRRYLGAGRLWLAWLITGLRVLVLIVNFALYPNATFKEIHALHGVPFLGETLSAPVGDMNPWRSLISLSLVLLCIFVVDAALTARKRGRSRQAIVLGASILIAILLSATFSGLMVQGILPGPFVALVYLVFVLAMAFELSVDLIRAREVAGELRDSRERMRLAARAADLGLWEWDVLRDEIWANDVSHARAEIAGAQRMGLRDYMALVHPDDRDHLEAKIRQSTRAEAAEFQAEYRLIGTGRIERWISAWGKAEYGENRQPLRLRGVSVDITARKQLEAEAQQHCNQLARLQRVFAMGQLSSALAHELNQPLGAILRNAEAGEAFLRRQPPDLGEVSEILVDIQKDDQRAVAVIQRMRSLLQQGALHFEAIAPRELVEQTVAMLKTEMQIHQVTLRIVAPTELPNLRGDRVHLQQVIINLLLNSLDAVNAVKQGPRQIDIQAAQAGEDRIALVVEDSGNGLDPDRLSDLFEPFYTTKPDGIGLGLSLCKTIVDAHGGRIRAENRPSGGARVELLLRIAGAEEAA
jgi:signal transduction histidine kinase